MMQEVLALKNPRRCGVLVCNDSALIMPAVRELLALMGEGGATDELIRDTLFAKAQRVDGKPVYQAVGQPAEKFKRKQASAGVGFVLGMEDLQPCLPATRSWCSTETLIALRTWLLEEGNTDLPHVWALLRSSLVVTFDPFWLVYDCLQGCNSDMTQVRELGSARMLALSAIDLC
jgi:hypothetical protein